MKIRIDPENRVLTIGNLKVRREHNFVDSNTFGVFVIRGNKLEQELEIALLKFDTLIYPRRYATAIGDVLGVSAAKLYKTFNALQYKCFIQPIEKYTRWVPRTKGKITNQWQEIIVKNKSLADQLLKDNLEKLIPFCCVIGQSPEYCKTLFGKGLWKRICNLSPTKIGLVSNAVKMYFVYTNRAVIDSKIKDLVDILISTKHRVLRALNGVNAHSFYKTENLTMLKWYNKNFAYTMKMPNNSCGYWFNVYMDTERLARQTEQPFSVNWNAERMKLKHDEYVAVWNHKRNIERTVLLNTEYPCYNPLQSILSEFNNKHYTITAFKTPFEMVEEGKDQKHCIGSYYLDMHHRNNTILFKLQDASNDKTYSCVQLSKSPNQWQINQHFKKHNADVDCEIAIHIIKNIVNHLNSIEFVI